MWAKNLNLAGGEPFFVPWFPLALGSQGWGLGPTGSARTGTSTNFRAGFVQAFWGDFGSEVQKFIGAREFRAFRRGLRAARPPKPR